MLHRPWSNPQNGIFTDGSLRPHCSPAWAFVQVRDGTILHQASGVLQSGGAHQAELTAIQKALQHLPEGESGIIFSDCKYSVEDLNFRLAKWKEQGWKRAPLEHAEFGPLKDLEILQKLDALLARRPQVKIRWIKGHGKSRWNRCAHRLAKKTSLQSPARAPRS